MHALMALIGVSLVTAWLVFRAPELQTYGLGERGALSAAWLVPAALLGIAGSVDSRLGAAAILSAATIGTGGRPALLMDRVIHLWPADKAGLARRRVSGYVALVATAIVVGIVLTR